MSRELIDELSKLKLRESYLKRCLDNNYYNRKIKAKVFEELKKVEKQIKIGKFKLRLEKELDNEK